MAESLSAFAWTCTMSLCLSYPASCSWSSHGIWNSTTWTRSSNVTPISTIRSTTTSIIANIHYHDASALFWATTSGSEATLQHPLERTFDGHRAIGPAQSRPRAEPTLESGQKAWRSTRFLDRGVDVCVLWDSYERTPCLVILVWRTRDSAQLGHTTYFSSLVRGPDSYLSFLSIESFLYIRKP